MRIALLVSLLSTWRVAALADPHTEVPPSIAQPAEHVQVVTHRTAAPDDACDSLDCVSVKDWSIKPNGAGIVVVIDGMSASAVHAKFEPDVPFFKGSDWHWVASVQTTGDGRMGRGRPRVELVLQPPRARRR
jgi:hypothetical protein